jgi:transposase-like protein
MPFFRSFRIEASNFRIGTLSSNSLFSFLIGDSPMPVNMTDVMTQFSTDEKCRSFLKRLRWPAGLDCPRCKSTEIKQLDTEKDLMRCMSCMYMFSVTAGTVFNDSHLPLTTWFMATLLICEAKKGISACQVQRTLGIGGYKTAWHLCHRIRHAMAQCDKPMLDGKVEMDETFVGGVFHGRHQGRRLDDNKEVVIGIRQRGGDLRFFHADDARGGTLEKYMRENLSEDLEVLFTDDYIAYKGATRRIGIEKKHKRIRHKLHIYVKGDIHTNTVESAFSLLKRGIIGTWHRVSAKHLQAYCEEMSFRFNRRKNDDLFVDTLRHMITAPVLTFKELTTDKEKAA